MSNPDRDPGVIAWGVAVVSLLLPWLGAALGIAGVLRIAWNEAWGWPLLAAGALMILSDVVIDFVWAHPTVSKSDEPDLNLRARQLVGRIVEVDEPIIGGRGKVRAGDTLWVAEGPDLPQGARATIIGCKGVVLMVEPA